MTSPWRISTRIGSTRLGRQVRAATVEFCGLNDEFGTTRSGRISSAASIRSAASRPPAISPDSRVLALGDLGVAELGAQDRVEDPRRLGADGRPAVAVEPDERRRWAPSDSAGEGGLEQRGAILGREVGREDRVDPADTCARTRAACSAAMAIAFSLVKSYCGSTRRARLGARALGLDVAVEVDRARRDDVGRGAMLAGLERRSVSFGRKSAPRIARQREDEDHATRSRGASRRCA